MDDHAREADARSRLLRLTAVRLASIAVVLGLAFFLAAGTLRYWQAWLFLAVLLAPMTAVMFYLVKNDPRLLERRLQMREKERPQKLIVKLASVFFIASWILPAFDRRWGWSSVHPALSLLADAVFVGAYLFFFRVIKANSFASRTVEVVAGQKVISTGPYALVRHPMYLAIAVMYGVAPLALGSFWALLAYVPVPFVLALRLRNEEEVLVRELPGYADYRSKVRYRLIPGVW
jgi:protein-S-isoprenylcysteine O-methyltransferase Ste14